MRRNTPLFVLFVLLVLSCVCLAPCATAASEIGSSVSGKVFFNTGSQNVPSNTTVSLVNGSNVSEYITGFNVTAGKDGFFQFTNVTPGFYKVYAWSPYYTEGYSAGINVTANDTYTASAVLLAMPYRANLTANRQHVVYCSSADITAEVSDYWGRPVGSGWQILFRTTVGVMTPDSAYTDKDGKVYSNLPWEDNSTPANVTVYAISTNGSSYSLLSYMRIVTSTPTATPSATAAPSVSPTAVQNATAVPSTTSTPVPSASATPKPMPGFVLITVLVAMGIALAYRKHN